MGKFSLLSRNYHAIIVLKNRTIYVIGMWKVKILSLFPECYPGPLANSVVGAGLDKFWTLEVANLRDYALDKHKSVDSPPCGGGGGMVMRADVLENAIESFFDPSLPNIYLSPRGEIFNQKVAKGLVDEFFGVNILCGRFEGVDERVLIEYSFTELSLGDFVVSSGDVALLPMLDCCVRQIPGVLGNTASLHEESFGGGRYEHLLEYPHYTRPVEWKGRRVPEVLLSGNHGLVEQWRLNRAIEKTKIVRPDLWDQFEFLGEGNE